MSAIVILACAVILWAAYRVYGRFLEKVWGVDPSRPTPAVTRRDNMDFVPAHRFVLTGHHFASIAGAAPIIGPIVAATYGWLPVLAWILTAGIFFGAVHDFGALLISVRHSGRNLSEIVDAHLGPGCRTAFTVFVWATSLLVIAAFTAIVADTFTASPAAAGASTSFVGLALIFGYAVTRRGLKILPATLAGVILLAACIALGQAYPLALSRQVWIALILGYILVSSITPIWILLQPRDYLNSFLLYALIAGALLGFLRVRPAIELPALTGWTAGGQPLFPVMFLLVACGAVSGYHAMFASTTTSKQVAAERDMKPVAFGGMLLESFLAVMALLVAASFLPATYQELRGGGGPIVIFSRGLSGFAASFGLPPETVAQLVVLTIASFALTSLDSVARVARFMFQDLARAAVPPQHAALRRGMSAKLPAAAITVALGGLLAVRGWQTVWPLFGAANQLIASFTFMILWKWLRRERKPRKMLVIPMAFMFLATMTGLILIFADAVKQGRLLLPVIAASLTLLGAGFAGHVFRPGRRSGAAPQDLPGSPRP